LVISETGEKIMESAVEGCKIVCLFKFLRNTVGKMPNISPNIGNMI